MLSKLRKSWFRPNVTRIAVGLVEAHLEGIDQGLSQAMQHTDNPQKIEDELRKRKMFLRDLILQHGGEVD